MLRRRWPAVKMLRHFYIDSPRTAVYNEKQRKDEIGLKEPQ
jgi:hypothetical protein